MTRNAEFQRQLWLHCAPSTVAWTLGLCSLFIAVVWLVLGGFAVASAATAGLWATTVGYGAILAASSLHQELRHNTWDWQRLSALTPWQMSWGKWLGATSAAWLVAACFVATLALIGPALLGLSIPWHSIALALLWGMVSQVWALNMVLLGWRNNGTWGWRKTVLLPWLLLLLLPGNVLSQLWQQLRNGSGMLEFWGATLSTNAAACVLGAVCFGMGLLALWRQMAQRLDVPTLPWAWPVGLLVMALVLTGFVPPSTTAALSWISCTALLGSAYIALHSAQTERQQWLLVHWHTTRRQWVGVLQALPLWPVSWVLGMAAAGLWSLSSSAPHPQLPFQVGWLVMLIGFQLLRDALLLTGFGLLQGRLKSPLGACALALLVFNVLLPLLAWGGAGAIGPALAGGLQPLVGYALTYNSGVPAWVFFCLMLVQVVLVACWVGWAFQRYVVSPTRDIAL